MPTDFHDLTARLISIHSKRLALRPVCEADTWPLFEATRNPAFNRHLLWEQPRSEWEVYRRVETIVEAARKGKLAAVSAVLKSTGAWVSLFRFQPTPAEDTVEMGIWTHDRYWHGLYSLELGRMCVDAAFATGGVQRLIGVTSRDNRSSQMLMRQVGLEVERESLRGDETGRLKPSLVFFAERERWRTRRREATYQAYADMAPANDPVLPEVRQETARPYAEALTAVTNRV